jgi:hypothetical protein
LGVFVLGLPNNFGKIDHMDGIVVIILLILSISHCGDAISFGSRFELSSKASFEYSWPMRLSQAMFTLVFFAAGVAKLRLSGMAWVSGDNLRYLLLSHAYAFHPPTKLGLLIAGSPLLCRIGAVLTVALELSMPLAFLVGRLRYPLLLASLAMQTMIALCLGVYFTPFLAAYLAFLPWERWAEVLTLRRATPALRSSSARTVRNDRGKASAKADAN